MIFLVSLFFLAVLCFRSLCTCMLSFMIELVLLITALDYVLRKHDLCVHWYHIGYGYSIGDWIHRASRIHARAGVIPNYSGLLPLRQTGHTDTGPIGYFKQMMWGMNPAFPCFASLSLSSKTDHLITPLAPSNKRAKTKLDTLNPCPGGE